MNTVQSLLHSGIIIMTPLLLASLGGLFTELTGMLNIALEGLLLFGAFFGFVGTYYSQSMAVGVLAAVAGALALASVMAAITLFLKANVFITGLAANLFASGMTVVMAFKLFGNKGVVVFESMPSLPVYSIPLLEDLPVIGILFSDFPLFVYGSYLLLLLGYLVLEKTVFGFRLKATGFNAQALESLGLRPDLYRFVAFLFSAVGCGIGGAMLSLNLGAFVPNITAGKGWIALVVIFLGNRKPVGLLLASLVFGLSEAFSNYAQGAFDIPADFILAIPYVVTLLAMLGYSILEKRRKPV
jgi:simple sugar transport system permease protein